MADEKPDALPKREAAYQHGLELIAAYRRGLEDAAKIADAAASDYEKDGWGHAACDSIAFRIRAKAKAGDANG